MSVPIVLHCGAKASRRERQLASMTAPQNKRTPKKEPVQDPDLAVSVDKSTLSQRCLQVTKAKQYCSSDAVRQVTLVPTDCSRLAHPQTNSSSNNVFFGQHGRFDRQRRGAFVAVSVDTGRFALPAYGRKVYQHK